VLEQFLNHIQRNKLCTTSDKVLLAVSGGIDSMVMLYLFAKGGFDIGVAHCNFQLRPLEANQEEKLVSETCTLKGLPFYCRRFNTKEYAAEKGLSTQLAARELRYQFFHEVAQAHGYNYIATAHQINDNIETLLINLVRGTGIDGLTGIPMINGKVIRPMLFVSRAEIQAFALKKNIQWLEDSSNLESQYHRNLIRNKVIPLLKEINPNLEAGFQNTLQRLQGIKHFSDERIRELHLNAVTETQDEIHISVSVFDEVEFPSVLLWEWIKEYGFRFDQCEIILTDHQSGKVFFSQSHQLLINRNSLIIKKREKDSVHSIDITADQRIFYNGKFEIVTSAEPIGTFDKEKNGYTAQLDLGKLKFPLLWRGWEPGDAFIPLGMIHRKKVSDFLIDLKLSRIEKEKVTVVESGGEIVWVVGYRISNTVKITPVTKEIFVMECHQSGH
jgi:tRNA(Ile)-lysidine synthase